MLTMTRLGHDHMTAPPNVGAQLVGTPGTARGAFPHLDGCSGCSISSAGLFGLSGVPDDQLEATAGGIIQEAGGASMVSFISVAGAMAVLDKADAKRLGQFLIAKGVDASTVEMGLKRAFPSSRSAIWGILATASAAASAYHGYRRNDSIGWGIWWFLMGGLFPVITPVIAVAQGYGKAK